LEDLEPATTPHDETRACIGRGVIVEITTLHETAVEFGRSAGVLRPERGPQSSDENRKRLTAALPCRQSDVTHQEATGISRIELFEARYSEGRRRSRERCFHLDRDLPRPEVVYLAERAAPGAHGSCRPKRAEQLLFEDGEFGEQPCLFLDGQRSLAEPLQEPLPSVQTRQEHPDSDRFGRSWRNATGHVMRQGCEDLAIAWVLEDKTQPATAIWPRLDGLDVKPDADAVRTVFSSRKRAYIDLEQECESSVV
jgi:hypothetical protein